MKLFPRHAPVGRIVSDPEQLGGWNLPLIGGKVCQSAAARSRLACSRLPRAGFRAGADERSRGKAKQRGGEQSFTTRAARAPGLTSRRRLFLRQGTSAISKIKFSRPQPGSGGEGGHSFLPVEKSFRVAIFASEIQDLEAGQGGNSPRISPSGLVKNVLNLWNCSHVFL